MEGILIARPQGVGDSYCIARDSNHLFEFIVFETMKATPWQPLQDDEEIKRFLDEWKWIE